MPGLSTTKYILLTSGTSWTVPNDWNSSNNTIHLIGGGGSGFMGSNSGSGGGGGYTKVTNFTATPGATVTYAIGSGGGTGTSGTSYAASAGGSTTWNSGANTAGGGGAGTSSAGGAGGTGSTFNGGSGLWGMNSYAGGGGAAGPNGAGVTATSSAGGAGDAGFGGAGGSSGFRGLAGRNILPGVAGSGGGNGAGNSTICTITPAGGLRTTIALGGNDNFGGGGSNALNGCASGTYPSTAIGSQGVIIIQYESGPTNFYTIDPNTNTRKDLGARFITKDYLLDVYPNIASATGSRKSPGLWAWGHGVYGNLGNNSGGSTTYYSSPVQVGTLANWKQVSTSKYFTLAVKTDGTMWSWGRNDVGQLGINAVGTRYYSSPVQIGALTSWKYVWAGFNDFAFAISNTGALWCWGGSGGNAGNNFALPIQTQNVYYSSPVQVGALTNWKSVVDYFAIKTDGSLWAWGNNALGVLGNDNRTSYSSPIQIGALTNWKQISMNSNITAAAVKTDGTLWTWGANLRGSLGIGVSTFNLYYSSPIQVGSLTNWKQVACGVHGITLAVKTDGTLWGWGWAASTIFGGNTSTYYSSPVQIGALTNWKSISMYNQSDTAYAIKTDGSLWFLGYSAFGESGTGTAVVNPAPLGGIQIGTSTTWKQVSGGLYSAAAIQDGYI